MKRLFVKLRKALWLPIKFWLYERKKEKNMDIKTRKEINQKMKELEKGYLEAEKINDREQMDEFNAKYDILTWLIT